MKVMKKAVLGWVFLATATAQAQSQVTEFWSKLECKAGAAHLTIEKTAPLTAKIILQDPDGISDAWTAKGQYVGRAWFKSDVQFDLEGQEAPLVLTHLKEFAVDGSTRDTIYAHFGQLNFACVAPLDSKLPPIISKPCHARYCP